MIKKRCCVSKLLEDFISSKWLMACKIRKEGLCCRDCLISCQDICTYARKKSSCKYYMTEIEVFWKKLLRDPNLEILWRTRRL